MTCSYEKCTVGVLVLLSKASFGWISRHIYRTDRVNSYRQKSHLSQDKLIFLIWPTLAVLYTVVYLFFWQDLFLIHVWSAVCKKSSIRLTWVSTWNLISSGVHFSTGSRADKSSIIYIACEFETVAETTAHGDSSHNFYDIFSDIRAGSLFTHFFTCDVVLSSDVYLQ